MAYRHKFKVAAIGLLVIFLLTAIALPIVSASAVGKTYQARSIKATNDSSTNGTQLSLAEKENEEKKGFGKKEHYIKFDFINIMIVRFTFLNDEVICHSNYITSTAESKIPLYLSKRYLII